MIIIYSSTTVVDYSSATATVIMTFKLGTHYACPRGRVHGPRTVSTAREHGCQMSFLTTARGHG